MLNDLEFNGRGTGDQVDECWRDRVYGYEHLTPYALTE
jgi:hypothetical protein